MSLQKTITLKFSNGERRNANIYAKNEAQAARIILDLMKETGAYGFGTQQTQVFDQPPKRPSERPTLIP